MAEQEIIEGNHVIAKFAGLEVIEVYHCNRGKNVKAFRIPQELQSYDLSMWALFGEEQFLRYHTSWDWLMPEWRKCIDVIGLWAHTHKDDNKSKVWLRASDNIRVALTSVDITKAFREISALIKWYNSEQEQERSVATDVQ